MQYDKSKDNTIELLGVTGVICSAACGLQQIISSNHYALTISALFIYGLAFAGFLLFMKMKKISVVLICISTILMFLEQAFLFSAGAILWLSFLVMLFSIVVVALIYIQQLNSYITEIEKDQLKEPWDE
jgi:hypothetical protein